MEHIFCRVTYDDQGKCNGVADLLQILGSIINGFALPLKDEHVSFLTHCLVPMHSASTYNQFHEELKYCTIQFVEKDGALEARLVYVASTRSLNKIIYI